MQSTAGARIGSEVKASGRACGAARRGVTQLGSLCYALDLHMFEPEACMSGKRLTKSFGRPVRRRPWSMEDVTNATTLFSLLPVP